MLILLDAQHFGSANFALFEIQQRLVGSGEGVFLHLRADGDFRREGKKFAHIRAGDVGDALDSFFHPQVGGIIQARKGGAVAVFFADGVDDQPAAGLELRQAATTGLQTGVVSMTASSSSGGAARVSPDQSAPSSRAKACSAGLRAKTKTRPRG